MRYGEYILSSTCEKCKRVSCIRCMRRTCMHCQRTFFDRIHHQDVELITNTGVCTYCGSLLTQVYLAEREVVQRRKEAAQRVQSQDNAAEQQGKPLDEIA
ncbi:MAG: hypothetical protein K6T91_11190 [Firmicutes bacterium]|nr:hypothetical protein [Bacillota bacterium]